MEGAVGAIYFYIHLTANLPRNLPVKKILKSVLLSLWPRFLAKLANQPCIAQ